MSYQNPQLTNHPAATQVLSIKNRLATTLLIASFFLLIPATGLYGWTSPQGTFGLLEAERLDMYVSKVWYLYDPYMPEWTTPYAGEKRFTKHYPANPDNPNDPEAGTYDFEHWLYGAATGFDLNLIRYKELRLYWDNLVHMKGTNHQVRHVGWEWKLGINIIPGKVDIYYHHHSQHVLERDREPHSGYPLLDELVLKMTFYQRKK